MSTNEETKILHGFIREKKYITKPWPWCPLAKLYIATATVYFVSGLYPLLFFTFSYNHVMVYFLHHHLPTRLVYLLQIHIFFPQNIRICDIVGDYGWWKEVHVPEKPAGCWVPQHWEAQRHTKRWEKPCTGMDWKNKGQSIFLLPSHLFGVSPHPFTFPITFTYLEIQSDCGVIIQTFCSFFLFLYIYF